MQVYNSLTNKKEEFVPLKAGQVSMYVCGVTVYDVCHIGHARASFVFDVMRQYLTYKGYRVLFVRNVTDVDDKIIQKAQKQGADDLVQATKEVSQTYYSMYQKDMQDLGIGEPDLEPKATGHIQDMISMIEQLIQKGYAYAAEGNVYFRVRKYDNYGNLSNQSIDEMAVGARVGVAQSKEDPLDFALWKKVKDNEPSWNSPWGKGRPGWHIECSVMSTKYLGETFDIHAGGRDLIFPHHENEIAQAICAKGGDFAKYWLHNGLLTINGEKMAKSLGNFFTIQDILKKFHPEVLKIFFLQSHYRSAVDYTEDKMQEAQHARKRFLDFFAKLDVFEINETAQERTEFSMKDIQQTIASFEHAMEDDFNTPIALSILFELLSKLNKSYASMTQVAEADYLKIKYAIKTLQQLGNMLGLFIEQTTACSDQDQTNDFNAIAQILLSTRAALRKEKLYAMADQIRDELASSGYVVEDLKDKSVIKRSGA